MKVSSRTVAYAAGFFGLVIAVMLFGGAIGVGIGLLTPDKDDAVIVPPTPLRVGTI